MRKVLASVIVLSLSVLLPGAAQQSGPLDPEGLSTRPSPRDRERMARESAATVGSATLRLTPIHLGPGQKFYDQTFPDIRWNDHRYDEPYERWLDNFNAARASRVSFANLDQYDMWFKTIPGGAYEFGLFMKRTYFEAMPENCRKEYEAVMQRRSSAAQSQFYPQPARPGEEEEEGPGCRYLKPREDPARALNEERGRLTAVRTTKLGGQYIAHVNPGQLVTAGVMFTTTNRGCAFVWKAEKISEKGLVFTLVEGGEEGLTWKPEYTLYVAIACVILAAALICVFLLKGT